MPTIDDQEGNRMIPIVFPLLKLEKSHFMPFKDSLEILFSALAEIRGCRGDKIGMGRRPGKAYHRISSVETINGMLCSECSSLLDGIKALIGT